MTLFLTVLGASVLGTFCVNIIILWGIGFLARRAEKERLKALEDLQKTYSDLAQKERERMEKYAKMEG